MGNPDIRVADKNEVNEELAEKIGAKRLGGLALDKAQEIGDSAAVKLLQKEYQARVADLESNIAGLLGEKATVLGRPWWLYIVTNGKGPDPALIDIEAYHPNDKQRIPQQITGILEAIEGNGLLVVRNGVGIVEFPVEDIERINLPQIVPVEAA